MTELRSFSLRMPSRDNDSAEPLVVTADGALHVPKVLQRCGLAGWEIDTLATFLAAVELRGGQLFDVGANVGVFSWLAAARGCAVTAFEPAPALADCIRALAEDNQLSIEVEELALSDDNGTARFYLSDLSDCSSSLASGFRPASESIEVGVETLDHYCERTGKQPGLIKIDTETTEPAVLRGALETIRRHRPWLIVEVLAGTTESAIAEVLGEIDYRWYQITHERQFVERREIFGCRAYRFPNWLFVPEPAPAALWDRKESWKRALKSCRPRAGTPLDAPALSYGRKPARRWRPTRRGQLDVRLVGKFLELCSRDDEGQGMNLYHGDRGLGHVAPPSQHITASPRTDYSLELELVPGSGATPRVQLHVFEYDREQRINRQRLELESGGNALHFRTRPETVSLRVGFRVAGAGKAWLGPLQLSEGVGRAG